MKSRARTPPLLVALMLFMGAPVVAHGQTVINLASSMTATCANVACDQVFFDMQLIPPPSASYIKSFTINAAGGWTFGNPALVKIVDGNGTDVTGAWTVTLSNGQLTVTAINFNKPTSLQPLFLTASFGAGGGTTGTFAELQLFTYNGEACFGGNCNHSDPPDIAFSGNVSVSPEPISVVLLGTGLAGLGALRRRRRKSAES